MADQGVADFRHRGVQGRRVLFRSNPRYFGTNASNIIYEHTATLFATMPETGAPPAGQMVVR